ncbi:VanZ family protein [Halalkalibacterium halodurans]|uniref:BH2294 protein n=1 Tax=Halalkalibacterium halodurans (strain ATCC BAA-125 / DSM 18197 / FERM 7344 / JCM 9153 / C-125) TaxID=272558 RepID=Q9KAJ3_HALH5|nr:VanZ family protein [Halalkalibacterium halodurans]BAB06013.1 BH2294 [Halalkalibacterium halodurans C-125]MDY7222845.1 VanZ family protein [Halalkalibacterium halodurans]MDY7242066.1 VanZ family protein [Halalkalibacterium halodurans]MED3648563.1 VanZ family protein [Halalkalibacterium halodurans]MED4080924.1 VanZ family protein [Halalkalibacterium halodurans]
MTNRKNKQRWAILFLLYLIVVLYITLFAWNYGASLGPEGPGGRNYNLVPLRSIYRISVFSPDIWDPIRILLGNVLLFIPFGFLLPMAVKKIHKLKTIVGLGCLFSLFIETNQFLFTYRVANVDDVILNTVGAWIGAVLYIVFAFFATRIHYIAPSDNKRKHYI